MAVAELWWRDERVGFIAEMWVSDFPWVDAQITLAECSPDLRAALEWMSRIAEADELEDPPASMEKYFDDWTLRLADGEVRSNSSPPVIDFENGTCTWRSPGASMLIEKGPLPE